MNTHDEHIRSLVKDHYTQSIMHLNIVPAAVEQKSCCGTDCCSVDTNTPVVTQKDCCGADCCSTTTGDPITDNLYSATELGELPIAAALASRGCGNPTSLAELQAGEKVLDLGSGGGIDVLLSAHRVGPTGFAYGLDMTDAMLALAERNKAEAGIENVTFLKGIIESIPLPDNSIDVIISNCVINLSADKARVLREAYRVLAPGGRLAISDIIIQGHLPQVIQKDMEAWAGCIAGSLEEEIYHHLLAEAGFVNIEFEITRRYQLQEIADSGASAALTSLSPAECDELNGKFVSAFIRAQKPL
jgi:arsenite methyltransferase